MSLGALVTGISRKRGEEPSLFVSSSESGSDDDRGSEADRVDDESPVT
jgi:hypothetical protein